MTAFHTSRRLTCLAPLALAAALAMSPALAQKSGEVKIALIASKTGPLEAYEIGRASCRERV